MDCRSRKFRRRSSEAASTRRTADRRGRASNSTLKLSATLAASQQLQATSAPGCRPAPAAHPPLMAPANQPLQLTTAAGRPSASLWRSQLNAGTLAGLAHVEDIRKSVNEYLFYEFAVDLEADESRVSPTWPFELHEVGRAANLIVFEFEDDEPYFALAGPSLDYLPKAGMTFDDLVLQVAGSKSIAADPIRSLDEPAWRRCGPLRLRAAPRR